MKAFFASLPVVVLCGCLSPARMPTVSQWLMEYRSLPAVVDEPKYGIARLSQVIVNPPYADGRMVVLRQDGTVALDANNVFIATPSALLKGAFLSALKSSGLFADVVGSSSGASASVSIEICVGRLALDCRQEDFRRAVVELFVRVLDGRSIVATVEGDGVADASDGDYGVAFSKAVTAAVSSALKKLR